MSFRKSKYFATFALFCGCISVVQFLVFAQAPSWWTNRTVLTTNSPNDFAPVNQGQVKNMAYQAYLEMESSLTNGAGTNVAAVIGRFSATNNYLFINIGQLKNLAKPFYDRFVELGLTTNYPWTASTADDQDYAIANIGQAKKLFGFHLAEGGVDLDGDGLSNGWETAYGLNPLDDGSVDMDQGASGDPDRDGLTNLQEYNTGCASPQDSDSDGDGLSDYEEVILLASDPCDETDGAAMLEETRDLIVVHWNMIYSTPLTFTNEAGSAADVQDIKNELLNLSGVFEEEAEE